MITNEKIKKWEEEIEHIQENQKLYNQKCNDKIKELRRKVQEETKLLTMENNQLIADTVRTIYGEVTAENLEAFRKQMIALSSSSSANSKEGESQIDLNHSSSL